MAQLFFDRIIDGLGNTQKMGQPKGRANNNFSRSWNLCVLNDNKKIINRSASFWLDFAAPANAQLEVINKHLHHVEVGVEGNQHPWPAELWWGQGDNWPPPPLRIWVHLEAKTCSIIWPPNTSNESYTFSVEADWVVLRTGFLECHIKIKYYQPFWCWTFLITHEFGQIFSSFALKICYSVKSWGNQTENDIFLDNMAFIWIKLSISTLKGMETLKTPVSNSHLSRSNTSGP